MTGVLIQTVSRNRERFPVGFMFKLDNQELTNMISQIVIASSTWGGPRTLPYAFTQEGVAMLSGVLRSERAVATGQEENRIPYRMTVVHVLPVANHGIIPMR